MKRIVVGLGLVVAVLWAAAIVAWVNTWPAVAERASAAEARYTPPTVEFDDRVGLDQAAVTAAVERMTNDPRGWHADLDQFTIRFVLPGIGGTQGIGGHIGMAYPDQKLVLVTEDAWTTVGPKFAATGGSLDDQRTWIVLHELGHLLGHAHEECPATGGPAPVMRAVDYTYGGCTYNVWPNP